MPPARKAAQGAATPGKRPSARPAAQMGGRQASKEGLRIAKPAPQAAAAAEPPPTAGPTVAPDDYVVPVREVVRPASQLQLGAAELEEDIGRLLTAGNPAAPASLVRYNIRERGYRPEPLIDHQLQHLALGGCLVPADSPEATQERRRRESVARPPRGSRQAPPDGGGEHTADVGAGTEDAAADDTGPRLRNQFNFADRAAQTAHRPPRERGTATEAPPTAVASGSCSHWEVLEAYQRDQERQRQEEEAPLAKAAAARKGGPEAAGGGKLALVPAARVCGPEQRGGGGGVARPGAAAQLLERMVHQNLLKDRILDFRYWEDPSDALRPEEGTLLPLWGDRDGCFACPRVRRRAVTALCWSPRYADLFAVGHGSFDYLSPTTGLVCCYSLKNPGHPEFCFATPAGVMCLDFHPDHPSLLAVGGHDGTLSIFDLRKGGDKPAYQSTAQGGRHSDPVWQVCWQRTEGHELQLHTVSTDGRITLWSVSRNELSHRDVLQLKGLRGREEAPPWQRQQQEGQPLGAGGGAGPEGDAAEGPAGIAGGCCFDFNRDQESMFVVGTEDGCLYKCSTAHASEYLQAYRPGHQLPVYAVRWNSLHSSTFLSAGADWKVKLWDCTQPRPVLSFDLRAPVGDVAWAPFSATVFAAVTDAGRVQVFDLERSRAAPVCVQRVARKTRLTKLAFNPRHPVLLVGSEQGGVTCFKLSPNLRRVFKPEAAGSAADAPRLSVPEAQAAAMKAARNAEAARLDEVLALAAKCNRALQEEDWELM